MTRNRISCVLKLSLVALAAFSCTVDEAKDDPGSPGLDCETGGSCRGDEACYAGDCTDAGRTTGVDRADAADPFRVHAVALAAGWHHTCAALSDGTVECWGGLFGSPIPIPVPGMNSARSVAAGGNQSCALLADSTVTCWLQTSRWDEPEPKPVPGLSGVVEVTVGAAGRHACALLEDHTVWCWGDGGWGQLGHGSWESSETPVRVNGIRNAIHITPLCALLEDGTVKCWGEDSPAEDIRTPALRPAFEGVVTLSGSAPVCGVMNSGEIVCDEEQLDEPVPPVGNVDSVAVGGGHLCVSSRSGDIECWGRNQAYQTGTESGNRVTVPTVVGGISDAVEVVAGAAHTCARLENGEVHCWGDGGFGQLGNGVHLLQPEPVRVVDLPPTSQIAVTDDFSCALTDEGVYCWGLGFNTPNYDGRYPYGSPSRIDGTLGASALSAQPGYVFTGAPDGTGGGGPAYNTCAFQPRGEVRCWSSFPGDAGFYDFRVPGNVVQRDVGWSMSCVLTADGTVHCGQEPAPVSGLPFATGVTAGTEHYCILSALGTVHCRGNNGVDYIPEPEQMLGLPLVRQLSSGEYRTCAVTDGGAVYCWGKAPLGDGTLDGSGVPREVSDLRGAVSVSSGAHSCALLESGRVKCWGRGEVGQLGNGNFRDQWMPVLVKGLDSATQVEAGSTHTCALVESGDVYCWGSDKGGKVGDRRPHRFAAPIPVRLGHGGVAPEN